MLSVFDSSDYFSPYKVHNSLLVMCTEELASITEFIGSLQCPLTCLVWSVSLQKVLRSYMEESK